MNQGNGRIGAGRTAGGIALGALLALAGPLLLLAEVFSPFTAVVLLPSIALVALYNWAGRGAAWSAALFTALFTASMAGVPAALIVLAMAMAPPLYLLRMQDKPFFLQMKHAVAAFGAGMLVAVAVLYFCFGGGLIERAFGQFPGMVRALPAEYVEPMLGYMSRALGRAVTLDSFYELYDSLIAQLLPLYQVHLPERLLSGALISALACVWLSNRMRAQRGDAAPGSYVPFRGWALPASTTGGLLFLVAAGWLLELIGVRSGETVYYAAYGIARVAFGAQTLGSAARRLRSTALRPGSQRAMLALIGILGTLWLPDAMMAYGCASAVFGSRGALRQRAQNRNDNGRFGGE